jgi:HK97 family phage portal protein
MKVEGQALTSSVLADWFSAGVSETAAGIRVTPESALRMTAVYACVTLISDTIGTMPGHLVRAEEGQRRTNLDATPLARLLRDSPNPEMDSGEFWRQATGWQLLRGNSLAWIDAGNARGEVDAIWPIPWTRVQPARAPDGRLAYLVSLEQGDYAGQLPITQRFALLAEETLHFRAFGLGPVGLSPIAQAAEAIGLAKGVEEYGAGFFARDARPGGFLKVPGKLDDDEWTKLTGRWRKLHEGVKRSHLMGVLEDGADWAKVGVDPNEAQFLETRRFQTSEIARLFRVPPHMIADVEKSTSWGTGIEQQGIGFVTYTLLPWINRLERVTRLRLLAADPALAFRFSVAGLLRGDTAARYAAYAAGRQWGWLSVNDIRALEDMDPVEGGDAYLQPLNMVPAGTQTRELVDLLRHLPSVGLEPPALASVTGEPASNGDGG